LTWRHSSLFMRTSSSSAENLQWPDNILHITYDCCSTKIMTKDPRIEMYSCKSCNFVAKALGWNDCHFFSDFLVCLKIKSHSRVIPLNDDSWSLLHCLGSHTPLHPIPNIQTNTFKL
jgi:hypothetical protein